MHYSDSYISIMATKCAPGILREHYKGGKIKKITGLLCTISACYLTVARQSTALESLPWSRAMLGASCKKKPNNKTILLPQPATDYHFVPCFPLALRDCIPTWEKRYLKMSLKNNPQTC